MALRVARGYRTVSYEAACVVSGSLPWELAAGLYAEAYNLRVARRSALRGGEHLSPAQRKEEVRELVSLRQQVFRKWEEALGNATKGLRAVGAIRPVLANWVDRRYGALNFRLVQVLTGHGCFGEYLHKIRKEPTTMCHQCRAPVDTADHTLAECPAWDDDRRALRGVVGGDLSLPSIIKEMLGREEAWGAVVSFCERVISQKEAAEREREADACAPPSRRRRGGAARRAHARLDLTPP
jgi:hypothetical protein